MAKKPTSRFPGSRGVRRQKPELIRNVIFYGGTTDFIGQFRRQMTFRSAAPDFRVA